MSRSPRRNLRRSLESLHEALATCEQYPDARADLVAAIGENGYAELRRVDGVLRTIVEQAERGHQSPA